jgi:hypothetical protein
VRPSVVLIAHASWLIQPRAHMLHRTSVLNHQLRAVSIHKALGRGYRFFTTGTHPCLASLIYHPTDHVFCVCICLPVIQYLLVAYAVIPGSLCANEARASWAVRPATMERLGSS